MLASLALVCPLSAGGTADASQVTAAEALRLAARHDRSARRYDKLSRREVGRAQKTLVRKSAAPKPVRRERQLKQRARGHRRKAKRYAAKARWHRKQAARLRRLAAELSKVPPPPPPVQRRAPMPLGAAVAWDEFQSDSRLRDTFLRYFDQMTPENEMKWGSVHPEILYWNFTTADEMIDWARANGKRVRGHTLIWNKQNPSWVENGTWTRETLLVVMENHIKNTIEHFKDRVHEWDVVNEAIDINGHWTDNIWYRVIGPDYVDYAFRYAHEADPDARLYYNEQWLDLPDDPHSQGVIALMRDLRNRGIPVDGVGMQGHVSTQGSGTQSQVSEVMHRFTELGLDVAITEIDVRTEGIAPPAEQLEAQRSVYGAYARACRLEPRCTSFSTWGIADPYSWYEDPALSPLLFDGDFNAKPAFYEVQDWIRAP
jgi:endo-1,4-beta-xylanase